jgi:hypothetical protein
MQQVTTCEQTGKRQLDLFFLAQAHRIERFDQRLNQFPHIKRGCVTR